MTNLVKSVSGLVGAYAAGDFYSFIVTNTEEIDLDLSVAYGGAELALYNNAGNALLYDLSAETTGDGWLNEILQPGTYYVSITDQGYNGEAAYTLTESLGVPQVGTASSNSGGTALTNAVSAGILSATPEAFLGWISSTSTTAWYSFNLNTISEVQATLSGLANNAQLEVTNASGQVLTNANGSSTSNASIDDDLAPLTPGTYYIEVSGYSATGFNLSLDALPIANAAGATITNAEPTGTLGATPQTFTGSVNAAEPSAYYSFAVAVPSRVSFTLSGLTGSATITLYNASGQQIDYSSSGTYGSNGSLMQDLVPLPAGTTYFVAVSGNNSPYALSVASTPITGGAGNTAATPIPVGSLTAAPKSFNGFVGWTTPTEYYSIVLASAATLDIDLSNYTGLSPAEGNPSVQLYNSTGTAVTYSDQATSSGAALDSFVLQPGTYSAEVTPYSQYQYSDEYDTNYTIAFSTGTPAVGSQGTNAAGVSLATAKSIGTLSQTPATFADWVGSGDASDYYGFTISAPSLVNLALTGVAISSVATTEITETLENASGGQISDATDIGQSSVATGASLIQELAAGTYFIDVSTGSSGSGYNLSASATALPAIAGGTLATAKNIGALGATQTFNGFVGQESPANDFEFTLSAVARVALGLADAGNSAGITLTLENISGSQLSRSNATYSANASILDTLAPGTYFAVVTDSNTGLNAGASYTLTASATQVANSAGETLGTAGALGIVAIPPMTVNNTNGTSYLYTYNPTSTVTETVAEYSGHNATGSQISDIVDNTDGTSLLYAYNPSSTVTLTASQYSGADATGTQVSDVVDNSNGTCLVYAYNPTSTVKQTTSEYSATNPTTGAPSGAQISDVVDNNDGTSLLYSYNPTSKVTQTTSEYSATNSANGAPAGNEISDVVNNVDGTSILYAYNPTSSVSQTATYYTSTNTSSGAPTGTVTSETFDYTNGQSAITTYTNGTGNTVDYSGPNGTGSVIPSITTSAQVTSSAGINGQALNPVDTTVITIAGSNQLIDPGSGNHTIQFAPGATGDTLVLHSGASDQILGFDPSAGDMLNLSALLSAANAHIGADISQLGDYVSIANTNGSATILFGGTPVASLVDGGQWVAQLQTLKPFAT